MTTEQNLNDVARTLARMSQKSDAPLKEETIADMLRRCISVLSADEAASLMQLSASAIRTASGSHHPEVTEVRPQALECDVVRFQNNKEKWVALVGLLDGYPYEIFTGLQDDEEGIILPKSVTEKFNPEYWNYAKLISGVLRYRMPIDHVIKLVSSLQLSNESINTWKIGVERALKNYVAGDGDAVDANDELSDLHPDREAED